MLVKMPIHPVTRPNQSVFRKASYDARIPRIRQYDKAPYYHVVRRSKNQTMFNGKLKLA